jgi:hypothetical protein
MRRYSMAVGVLMNMSGVTQDQYEQLNQKMFGTNVLESSDAPEGLIMHSAGPTPEGWYVYDVWESKDAFQRFVEDKLGPAVQELTGGEGGGNEPQYFEVFHVVQAA